jgi:putative transposase
VSLEDRQQCINLVKEAEGSGAGRAASCQILELSLRTIQRWEENPDIGDQRSGPKTQPANGLTDEEKKMIIDVVNSARFRDQSPWQIVAKLADSGQYLASESSFYRVMKANDLLAHRSKSKPRRHQRPRDLIARNPNEVYSWDITYMKSPVAGMYFYLYLVEDIFSRMIVGWTVEATENGDCAAALIDRICHEQGIPKNQLTLHSDNGGPMKAATMLVTLQRLGVVPSFSRPSISDDNPFSESLFKTLKYRPSYPDGAFACIDEARSWVRHFVAWYNTEHLHSEIRFVTPRSRHEGSDVEILKKRHAVYTFAKQSNPLRWSGQTRNWSRITEVHLNPKKETKNESQMLTNQAA